MRKVIIIAKSTLDYKGIFLALESEILKACENRLSILANIEPERLNVLKIHYPDAVIRDNDGAFPPSDAPFVEQDVPDFIMDYETGKEALGEAIRELLDRTTPEELEEIMNEPFIGILTDGSVTQSILDFLSNNQHLFKKEDSP